ncbi:MAG: ParB/RepB/Spo0J family partition protein [bacterium]|nr:ParB/RepB/Spo0J family partition protein [bacterium]
MERKGLGKGLASLIRPMPRPAPTTIETIQTPETKRGGGLVQLAVDLIEANPSQPRKQFDSTGIAELAASIRQKGVLLPLIVCPQDGGGYQLLAGERRLRAARLAGLLEVPVIIRDSSEGEGLEIALIENIQRQNLNPIEEAQAYQELMERFLLTQDQVAEKVGKERATVANLIRLLKLPQKVKDLVREGKVSMGHARALLAVSPMERQFYYCDKIVQEGWSVRQLEAAIGSAEFSKKPRKTAGNRGDLTPGLRSLVDEMRQKLGTQVQLLPQGQKKGKIVIEYYSPDDLNRLYHLITGQQEA